MRPHIFKDFLHSARTAEKWERLRRLVSSRDKLGIILYGEPDPDALGAGWALQHLLRAHVQSVKMVAAQPVRRNQNVRLVNAVKIPLDICPDIPWTSFTKLAIVDAQPDFFTSPPPVPFDIVIDHHPRRSHYSFRFSDVRPNYASVSTVLLEYLLWAGVTVPKKLATALWFGLRTDSDNLSTSVNAADLAAYGYLYRRADRNILQWLERSEMPVAYSEYYIKALQEVEANKKRLVVYLGDVPKPDACVLVADFLSRFIGIRWVAVAGACKETLYVIFRGGSFGVNVGRIARRKLGKLGSAGGHQSKARAEIPLSRIAECTDGDCSHDGVEGWLRSTL